MTVDSLTGLPELRGVDAYIAGGEEFVTDAGNFLLAGGLPRERLFIDALNRRPRSASPVD